MQQIHSDTVPQVLFKRRGSLRLRARSTTAISCQSFFFVSCLNVCSPASTSLRVCLCSPFLSYIASPLKTETQTAHDGKSIKIRPRHEGVAYRTCYVLPLCRSLTSMALTSILVRRKGTFSGNLSLCIATSKQSPKSIWTTRPVTRSTMMLLFKRKLHSQQAEEKKEKKGYCWEYGRQHEKQSLMKEDKRMIRFSFHDTKRWKIRTRRAKNARYLEKSKRCNRGEEEHGRGSPYITT